MDRPLESARVTREARNKLLTFALAPIVLAAWLSGCRPRTSAEDMLLERSDPSCHFEAREAPLPEPTQQALHQAGQGLGASRAAPSARRYTDRQTHDGYLVRGTASALVMSLSGLGLGGLAAALLLALWVRRPTPRWAERLGQSIAREIEQLRALGASGDPLARALMQRFEEPLTLTSHKAQRIVDRAIGLSRRAESATASAHLESLHGQLEGLLGRVERIHLQILVWNERQLREEDELVKAQVAAAIAELTAALEEVR